MDDRDERRYESENLLVRKCINKKRLDGLRVS